MFFFHPFWYEAGLPSCSVAITSLVGAGSDSKLLEQEALKVQPWLVLFPLKCVFFPLPAPACLPHRGAVLKQVVPM